MQIDTALWIKIYNHDQEAYAAAYRYYYKRFYNYGRKFTNSEFLVEDAVQETLILLWDKRKELMGISHPGTYFYTAFRHLLARLNKSEVFAGSTL